MLGEKLLQNRSVARANQPHNYFLSDFTDNYEETDERVVRKVNYLQSFFIHFMSETEKVKHFFIFNDYKMYVLIIATCSIMSIAALIISKLFDVALFYKNCYVRDSLMLLLPFVVLMGVSATHFCSFCPTAEGSGLPELKTVLSGTSYSEFLSPKTFYTKYAGIMLVRLSGLGVGFEAAFSHLSTIVAHQFFKLAFFKDLCTTRHNWKVALGASASLGMVVVFGAPIGGIIFGIEVFTSNFKVSNLLKFFVASTVSYFFWKILNSFFNLKAISSPKMVYRDRDLIHFVIVGLIVGLCSAGFVTILGKFVMFKRTSRSWVFKNRYIYVMLAILINNLLIFPHNQFFTSFKDVVGDLISFHKMIDGHNGRWWHGDYRIIWELIYSLFVRFVQMLLFQTCPIPFGTFTPGLIFGAMLGRLYGECLRLVLGPSIEPNHFALAGLGAFISAIQRTFSPMIFVLEMTGQMDMLLPILIVQIVSFGVCSTLSIGLMEMTIAIRKLPFMPSVISPEAALKPASAIAEQVVHKLTVSSSIFDVLTTFGELDDVEVRQVLPITTADGRVVLGHVKLKNLYDMFESILKNLNSIEEAQLTIEHRNQSELVVKKLIEKFGRVDQSITKMVSDRVLSIVGMVEFKDTVFEMQTLHKKPALIDDPGVLRKTYIVNQGNRYSLQNFNRSMSGRFLNQSAHELVEKERQQNLDRVDSVFKEVLIDWKDAKLAAVWSPIRVIETTEILKIQYIFLQMGPQVIWIEDSTGALVSFISKDEFLKYKLEQESG